tara:strand:+ start:273 stop:449 length:177 start_codon:yes stop_codon:yes gene_type:complete
VLEIGNSLPSSLEETDKRRDSLQQIRFDHYSGEVVEKPGLLMIRELLLHKRLLIQMSA